MNTKPAIQFRLAFSNAVLWAVALHSPALWAANGVGVQACTNTSPGNGAGARSGSVCHLSGSTQIFTDRAAFVAALAAGHIENAFENISAGAAGILNFADGGFEYIIYTQFLAHGALYNGPGFLSTDRASDKIIVRFFSGAPVTAVGGNFWPVDFSSRPIGGTINLLLSDGTRETIQSSGSGDFRGFISSAQISSLSIDAPDISQAPVGTSPDRWPAMDNLVVGNGQ